ncbi:nitrate ABC transporter substrate-binding protein [Pseudonocardia sp. EC080610-09]|jgi:NitT/TauT family transport system substrate-binding protein|uniref:ABC transporter substrate-binding protein n=1 Tax=unclassified Pseudonocardia TaxID=2619320 RepID=UPI0006CB6A64|nr:MULTISPECIES: ABC transporter substrate-binding protein [unclassified Pseudonocardia]ALE72863.1 nitrate ABC transporter substrate-binding protein [Pseudonocardia sp. EC080625-04]ALL76186.1 nitrate ABC transporter substrate-binding protein [Pseudonocardia sp. EC080610-09]ALL83211.1 nitrate ABC transporter substrate-binding protein [Pseudonocardia sp. EC080619-01]
MTERPKVTMELLSLVFSLPQLVAQDEGFFADEGVDVEFVTKAYADAGVSPLEDHQLLSAFGQTKSHFESGEASLYRACEWGQVRRAQDTTVGGRVVSKRAAVNGQAIMVRGDHPATHPQDLAGVTVAVNFHHGSHYVALQTLEGFLPREEITVAHYGGPQVRFEALRDGTVEAAALMEPWITLAEKQGYKVLAEAFYVGAEIASPQVDEDTYARINRAVVRAVAKINEDPRPYLHHLTAEIPAELGSVEPHEIPLGRLRYVDPAPYPEAQFQRTYDWMVSWGLISDDRTFDALVKNLVDV